MRRRQRNGLARRQPFVADLNQSVLSQVLFVVGAASNDRAVNHASIGLDVAVDMANTEHLNRHLSALALDARPVLFHRANTLRERSAGALVFVDGHWC